MSAASTTAAAIVAGGRARRFGGQDKSRLVVEGRSIIVRQIEILQRVADEIFVAGGEPDQYADLGLRVYPDLVPGIGAIGGILTALTVSSAESIVVVACDLPFLESDLLAALVDASAGHDAAWVRTARGVEPLVACYRRSARDPIRGRIETGQLKAADLALAIDVAELGPDEVARYGPLDRLLANVNTPADYARVQYGSS
jgi:molybdopterin-guanine dinucleotide biosynthesis protein A